MDPTQQQQVEEEVLQEPEIRAYTKEEIEKEAGAYDDNGFYILETGAFYDPNGYYFDENGYDGFGGYYDDFNQYVPGPEYADEYYRKYREQYGYEDDEYDEEEAFLDAYYKEYCSESDEDEDHEEESKGATSKEVYKISDEQHRRRQEEQEIRKRGIKEEAANRIIQYANHINPALEWLNKQPPEKKLVIKIQNLNDRVKESHIEAFLKAQLDNAGLPVPQDFSSIAKIVIDKDHQGRSIGRAWFSSADRNCIKQLINAHNKYFHDRKLKTYLMGVTYDQDLEVEEEEEFGYQRFIDSSWVKYHDEMKESLYRLKKKSSSQEQQTQPVQVPVATTTQPAAAQQQQQQAKPQANDDDDDYGVETASKKKGDGK